MREIALVWWAGTVPRCLAKFGYSNVWLGCAPADKYSAVQIAQWLQGEEELIRYRIGELMAMGLADNYEDDEEE